MKPHTTALTLAVCSSLGLAQEGPRFIGGVATLGFPGEAIERRDVNGDGVLDIVFLDLPSGTIGYAPGVGAWGFGAPVAVPWSGSPEIAQVGYFLDPDGFTLLEAFSTEWRFSRIVDGVLTVVATEHSGPRFVPLDLDARQLSAGDLDGDGLEEIVYPTLNGFAVRWSDRQIFTRYQEFFLGGPALVLPIDDYNNDGFPDVLVHSVEQGGLVFFPGGPIDKLGDPVQSGVLIGDDGLLEMLPRQLGRFNDNDALDMVTVESGQATFHLDIFTDQASSVTLPVPPHSSSGSLAKPVAVGDYDGDGRDDVLFRYRQFPPISGPYMGLLWLGPLSPDTDAIEFTFYQPEESRWAWSADVDADGLADLVSLGSALHALRTRSGPDLLALGPSIGPARNGTRDTLAIDLDGDGLPELLNASPLEILDPLDFSRPGVDLGVSGGFMSLPLGASPQGGVRIAHDGSALRIIDFAPDGTMAEVTELPLPGAGSVIGLFDGDFDGDGVRDLGSVFRPTDTGADEVLIYRGGPGGSFELFAAVPADGAIKPAAADFNGDGLTDLFVGDPASGTARVLINLGEGAFETTATWNETAAYWFDATDFDGDGYTDILGLVGTGSGGPEKVSAAVWFGQAGGAFESPLAIHTGQPLVDCDFADFDGNGLADMVLVASAFGGFPGNAGFVYVQTSPRVFELRSVFPATNASGVAIADINGNGVLDIVTSSGQHRQTLVYWGDPEPCPADFNGDGSVNFFDLSAFIQAFADGDPSADLAEPFGVWNFFDVSAFVQLFNAGCP